MAKVNPPAMLYEDFTGRTPERFDRVLAYMPYLYNWTLKLTRNVGLAEDIVQEALLNALRFYDRDKPSNVEAWVRQITINKLRDYYRKNGLPLELVDDERLLDIMEHSVEKIDLETTIDRIMELQEALDFIPSPYREPLMLVVRGVTNSEIADRIGRSLPTAKTRIRRGRLVLRELMGYRK